MDEFVDALKYAVESGAFGKVLRDNPTGEVSGIKSEEDKERFETIVDALCCALLHDNDSATCMFSQWRINKVRLERTYKREKDGRLTSERAEQVRENYRCAMTEFETAFINALLGEYYDLIEPMPLQSRDVAKVVRARFIKNYAMIKDE